ncbi:unnamed protein product, partial [Medioppia subpectinata]
EVISTVRAPTPIAPYSQGVRAGDYLFITGQISTDVSTQAPVVGPLAVQYETTLNNVLSVTEAAGGSADDIVKLGVYVTDVQHIHVLDKVIEKLFRRPYPARHVVPVNSIPRGSHIEIDAVVYLPQNK